MADQFSRAYFRCGHSQNFAPLGFCVFLPYTFSHNCRACMAQSTTHAQEGVLNQYKEWVRTREQELEKVKADLNQMQTPFKVSSLSRKKADLEWELDRTLARQRADMVREIWRPYVKLWGPRP